MGIDSSNPLSFNRYQYSFGNPYKYKDPDGRFALLGTMLVAITLKTIDFGMTVYDTYQAYQNDGMPAAVGEIAIASMTSFIPGSKIASRIGRKMASKVESGAWRLLGANKAKIDPRKLTEYALNPNHPVGGNKAKVFNSVLGYNRSNAGDLLTQLRLGVMNNTPIPGRIDRYGTRFTLDIPIEGPAGSATVRTGWIYRAGTTTPEMTTLYVK